MIEVSQQWKLWSSPHFPGREDRVWTSALYGGVSQTPYFKSSRSSKPINDSQSYRIMESNHFFLQVKKSSNLSKLKFLMICNIGTRSPELPHQCSFSSQTKRATAPLPESQHCRLQDLEGEEKKETRVCRASCPCRQTLKSTRKSPHPSHHYSENMPSPQTLVKDVWGRNGQSPTLGNQSGCEQTLESSLRAMLAEETSTAQRKEECLLWAGTAKDFQPPL